MILYHSHPTMSVMMLPVIPRWLRYDGGADRYHCSIAVTVHSKEGDKILSS